MTPMPTGGLYVLTDPAAGHDERLVSAVAAALRGGAAMIQYRDKSAEHTRREREAEALLQLCRGAGVPLVVNDDVALAAAIGADGVHLGRDDDDPAAARARLGDTAIIGVSCYNDSRRALAAQAAGADYVAFGRFHASGTKPDAVQATPALLERARPALTCPVVAIGGITAENGAALLAAGADLLAAVGAVIARPDPEAAARAFAPLFRHASQRRAAG